MNGRAQWLFEAPVSLKATYYSDPYASLEFGDKPIPRPEPNTLDPEAAEPIFTGRVRTPEAPLLDAAKLKLSSRWNQAIHPKTSGITLAELRTRLERYLDRAALDALVRRANAGKASLNGSDEATLVTLLAHQFQLKICRTPTVGDITKPCTMNGCVAEDTLDALGFVYHKGKTLNAADQSNSVAAKTLGQVPMSAFAGIEPGLTAKTWWSYMVNCPWLGLPIKQGIHLILLKRLRRAQHTLMSLPAYANLSPSELGQALGLEEEHKGARPSTADWSMHLFGLGIDIGFTRNPWLSNPKRNTAKLAAITLRAARLVGPSGAGEREGITARYLHGLAIAHRDTEKIHKILADWSRWLEEYFSLAGNAKRLESLLPIANVIYPDAGWFKPGESLAAAATRWTRMVRTDFDDFAVAVSRGGNKAEVRHGFMDLARDLLIALRDEACLGWGAVDFGPTASGDIMHFDCRVKGIGRTIAKTSGKPYVPEAGHPCLSAGGGPLTQSELEQPVWARRGGQARKTPHKPSPAPPPPTCPVAIAKAGHWLAFPIAEKAIPKYQDDAGKLQSTDCAVNVPDALENKKQVDLLVFFHGLFGPCKDCFDPDPEMQLKKFGLDAQIHNAKRKVVLAVPRLFWKSDKGKNVNGIWTAANFNKFVEEVLKCVSNKTGVNRTLGSLIIAGHSRAYAILTPLALEFNQGVAATQTGALANLSEVWAMDSTYSLKDVRALETWASTLPPRVRFCVVYSTKGTEISNWKSYYKNCKFEFGPPPNLRMCAVDEGPNGHCIIPTKFIGQMLSGSFPPSGCKPSE